MKDPEKKAADGVEGSCAVAALYTHAFGGLAEVALKVPSFFWNVVDSLYAGPHNVIVESHFWYPNRARNMDPLAFDGLLHGPALPMAQVAVQNRARVLLIKIAPIATPLCQRRRLALQYVSIGNAVAPFVNPDAAVPAANEAIRRLLRSRICGPLPFLKTDRAPLRLIFVLVFISLLMFQ